jgi:xylulokinase
MGAYVIGIDIGTGSSKAVLAGLDGSIIRSATRTHEVSLPRPGWAEMDAERDWWREVTDLARELTAAADGPVEGVCVSGLGPCLVVCNADLKPLRPAILYGIDMRAMTEIAELTERFGAEAILNRCGKDLSTQAVGPKMVWLQRNEPNVWARTERFFSAHSFIVARLTGEYTLDHHTASQCDPLYDIDTQDWASDWAAEVLAGVALPRLAWPGEVVGSITAAAAEATGLAVGTPVCAGTVDAWAEAFSAGVRNPGDLMLMYGSTMFFVQVLESISKHSGLWTTSGIAPGSHTLAAGMATSGSLTGWVQKLCGNAPFEQLVAEAAEIPPGSEGLLILPYFAGERTPIFDPDARGVIAGLTLRHRRSHLFRAAYEGIAFGIRQIVDFYEKTAGKPERIVAVGGGTQGGLWTQVVSDVTGRKQLVPAQTIGASLGDALLAAIGTGLVPPETDWAEIGVTVEPDPSNRKLYDQLFSSYCALYPATRDTVHQLVHIEQTRWANGSRSAEIATMRAK